MTNMAPTLQTLSKRLEALEERLAQLQRSARATTTAAASSAPGEHPYITSLSSVLDGEPCVSGTRTPVRAIVEHWKFGDPPEDIARKLPHLRLAQIFDALGYYDDHRAEIERYIASNRVPVDD